MLVSSTALGLSTTNVERARHPMRCRPWRRPRARPERLDPVVSAFYGLGPLSTRGARTMPLVPPMLRSPGRRLALLLLAGISAACSGPELTADAGPSGLSCVDDSPECVGRRQTALRQLVAAEDRAWVRQPAT